MYDHLSLLFWEKKIHYKTPRGIIKVNTQSTAHMDVDKEKEDKNCKIQPSSQVPPWLKLQKNKKEKRKPWHPYKKWSKKQFFNFKISSLSLLNILLFLSYGHRFFYFFLLGILHYFSYSWMLITEDFSGVPISMILLDWREVLLLP